MTKYEATDSRGTVHKRGTQNRTYTHCVVAYHAEENYIFNDVKYTRKPTASWAGSLELAQARAKTLSNYHVYNDKNTKLYGSIEIIEAREV